MWEEVLSIHGGDVVVGDVSCFEINTKALSIYWHMFTEQKICHRIRLHFRMLFV
jgi:hypothetical protein